MSNVLRVWWVGVLMIIIGGHFAWKVRLAQLVRAFTLLEVTATGLTSVFLFSTLHPFCQS